MQPAITLFLYAVISLSIAGWFNIIGPEYTWWAFIHYMGN